MGEPAIPTPAEREHVRAFAKAVVDSVRNDEDPPHPQWEDGDAMDDDMMTFRLAQEIGLLLEEARQRGVAR